MTHGGPNPARPAARGPSWSWAEANWALAWAAAIAVLTALPYVYAAMHAPEGMRYLGFVFNPDEPSVHLSWIRQASEGTTFLRNEFTSEPHVGRFFNLYMLAAGRVAGRLGWSAYRIWAVSRVVAGTLLSLAIYLALIGFTEHRRLRRVGLAVVTLSAGLGWYWVGRGTGLDPVDVEPNLVMPEAFTFLTIYLNPLFATSMVLLVTALVAGERALRRLSWPATLLSGAAGLLLANIHTYDAIPCLAVLTVYLGVLTIGEGGWRNERLWRWLVIVALTVPAVAYQWWLISSQPLYAAKANTPTPTPPLRTMLVSYGLLVPLAITGAVYGLRRKHWPTRFWTTWAVVQGLCILAPVAIVPFQRKMIEGLHIAVGVLAAAGLVVTARQVALWIAWLSTWQRFRQNGWAWAVRADIACRRAAWAAPLTLLGLLALVPSNVLFVDSTLRGVETNNAAKLGAFMPPFYLPEDDYQAMLWIRDNLPRDAVVLCLPYVGSYLPGLAGRTVYVGHWAETIDFGRKLGALGDFLTGPGSGEEKYRFLRDAGVTHLYYGSYERQLSGGLYPQLRELAQVYPAEPTGEGEVPAPAPVRIFRVLDPSEVPPAEPAPEVETAP